MASLISMAVLGLAGSAAASTRHRGLRSRADVPLSATGNVTLSPIPVPGSPDSPDGAAPGAADPIVPQTNITMTYGVPNTTDSWSATVANVTLTTPSGGVLLEAISSITTADCSADSVSLTFSSVDALSAAYTAWVGYTNLTLVTNHLGDCDTEFERGFFLASSYTQDESTLTLVATALKSNVTDVASRLSTSFSGVPGTVPSTTQRKRDIVIDPSDITFASEYDFPELTLYSYEDYVTATANSGSLDVSVTLGGYLDFNIWTFSLEDMYVDVETTVSTDLVLELNITAPYSNTFEYTNTFAYYLVDIAGILTFGPAVGFAVGADLAVDAALDLVLDVGAELPNATVRLDFVDSKGTSATGWTPTYHADLNITEAAAVSVRPFVQVTAEIELEVLGGLLDLSSGFTPEVGFPTTVTLAGEQDVGASGTSVTVTQAGSGGCADGVEVVSAFDFSLEVFITEFVDFTAYNTTIAIADECYSWA